MKTINEVLKNLYIRACLDAFEEKNKGKGKILCKDKISQAKQDILKLIIENMPKLSPYENYYRNTGIIKCEESIKKLFE